MSKIISFAIRPSICIANISSYIFIAAVTRDIHFIVTMAQFTPQKKLRRKKWENRGNNASLECRKKLTNIRKTSEYH